MKKGDFLIIIIIGFLEAALVYFFILRPQPDFVRANVSFNGSVLREVDLRKDGQFSVEGKNGEVLLEVSGGSIRFLQSNCPDHVCVKTGWISSRGRVAACVPNGVLIEIVSGVEQDWDVIVG